MAKIFTQQFKTFVIDALIASNPIFYFFLGKHTPFDSDASPPTPTNSTNEIYTGAFDNMFVAKQIANTNISYMIPRVDWAYGTGYGAYRNSLDLYNSNFYVSVSSPSGYDVFKCLSNNNTLSTYPPDLNSTSPTDDIYETADGYQWKYMYSIPTATFEKFATQDYIPVYANAAVKAAAVDGAVDFIEVTYRGSNYDAYTNGTFQSVAVGGNTRIFVVESSASPNNNFYVGSAIKVTQGTGAGQMRTITEYTVSGSTRQVVVDTPFTTAPATTSTYEITPRVTITGSGNNFLGRALVNSAASNSIYKVEVVNRGTGYYYGQVAVVGNTGGVTNTATLSLVVSPKYGHGYDPIDELGGHYLCLTTTFDTANTTASGKLLDQNDFRTIGIVANPSLANVQLTTSGATGLFTAGELVTQQNTGATGIVVSDTGTTLTLTNVSKNFLTGNSSYRYITGNTGVTPVSATVSAVYNNGSGSLTDGFDYLNATTRLTLSATTGTFANDEVVTFTSNTATSNAVVYYANSTALWLTKVRGTIGSTVTGVTSGATGTISANRPADLRYGIGDILYIENNTPINKISGQTETVKAIIEF